MLNFILDALIYTGVFGILAISLNLEAGFTRLMNYGKVAFFGVGAYTSALLALNGYNFIFTLIAAIFMSALAGFLISLPTLRLREDYFAIVTVSFGEILRLFFVSEAWLTNGTRGLPGIPRPLTDVIPINNYLLFYVPIVFIFLFACYLIATQIVNSPFGRVLKSIREDEVASKSLGKDIFKFKTKSLIIGSSMAGIAGHLFSYHLRFISPDMFFPVLTFTIWTMMIIGGIANIKGSILGALLVQTFERGMSIVKDYIVLPIDPLNFRIIVIGFILILFMIYRPEGIIPEEKNQSISTRLEGNETSENK